MESKTYKMMHFVPGKQVMYDGNSYIVDHVTVRGFDLYVNLVGKQQAVNSEEVYCEPTVFLLSRQ